MLEHTTHDTNTASGSDALWSTTYGRDGAGNLTGATIDDDRDRTVTLVNDAEGRVLQRDEVDGIVSGADSGDPRELHYYLGGRRIGSAPGSRSGRASRVRCHAGLRDG